MFNRPNRRVVLQSSICALLAAAAIVPAAQAQQTWTGGVDSNWSTATNWSSAEPTAFDDVTFPSPVPATGSTITLSAGEQAFSLTFLNGYTLTGGDLTLGSATSISVNPNFTTTINSVLGGAGTSLTKTGPGTLVLGGTNTYAGKTLLSGGTLSILNDANLGAVPATAVTDQLTISGATLKFGAAVTLAANRGTTFGTGSDVIDGGGFSSTLAGPNAFSGTDTSLLFTSSTGSSTFTITGTGANNTSATNTITIDSNVTLNMGSAGANGNLAGNTLQTTVNAGGVLRFNRSNSTTWNAPITGAGSVNVANVSGQTVTLNPLGSTVAYAGGANTFSGGLNLAGSNSAVVGTTNTALGAGAVNFTAGAGTIASSDGTARNYGNTLNIQGSTTGTVTLGQTTTGTGALTFGNVNIDRVPTAITRTITNNVAVTIGALNDGAAGTAASNLAFSASQPRTITGNGNFSGNMTWSSGVVNVIGPNAAIASIPTITQGDGGGADETAVFGTALTGGLGDVVTLPGGLNRIGDTSTYAFNATGPFTYNGAAAGSTGTTETIGTVSVLGGRAYITLNPSSDAPLGIVANTLTRTAGSALFVRGAGLGGTGNGQTSFVVNNAASLLSGGNGAAGSTNISILPFAVGDASSTGGGTGFLTHDAGTGLRLLTAAEYDSSIAGAGLLRNVSAAGGETVSSDTTINSLRLTGGTTTLAAGTRLRPASGAVMFTGAATLGGAGTLEFGASEGIINVSSNTAITPTLSARIAGTGGLTFAGNTNAHGTNNVLVLSGDNTATGTYTVDAGLTLRLGSSAALNDNSLATLALKPLSVLQLNGNNAAVRNFVLNSFSGTVQNNAATDATLTAYQLASQTFAAGTTISNGSTGKLNLVFDGNNANTTTINNTSGNFSYTGTTEVRTGTVTLSGSGVGILSGTTGVVINGGTFRLTNSSSNATTRVNDAATVVFNNGTFDFDNNAQSATNFSEVVGALTLNSGTNILTVDKAATSQTSTLTFASLARNPGAWALFNSQNNNAAIYDLGASAQSKLVFTTAPTLDDGLIGGWALIDTANGVRNFATYSGGSVTNLTGQVTTLASGANSTQNVTLTASPAALTANTQINSLVLTPTAAASVALGGNTLRVESGGILLQGNQTTTFSGGTLTAGNGNNTAGELIFHVSGTSTATVTAPIVDNGTGAVSISKNSTGTLDLTGAVNTYTGKTYLNSGTTKIAADSGLGTAPTSPVADSIVLSGGTLDVTAAAAGFELNANRGITVGAGTSIISLPAGVAGAGKTLTYNGAINQLGTTEGNLTIQSNLSTTNVDPGKFVGTLSALNVGGTFRFESGTVSVTNASNVIGRSLQIGVQGPGSLTYTSAGGSLKVGAGVTGDVLELGVVNIDPSPSNTSIGTSTLNVSALANFTANVDTIRLGIGGANNRSARANFVGATNNDITAATSILISRSLGASQVGQNSSMTFGSGINNVTTPLMSVGEFKGDGTVGIAAGGTLNIGGFAANTMNLNVGLNVGPNTGGTGTVAVGTFNTTGGTLNASFNALTIGSKSNAGTAGGIGAATGTFTTGISAANNVSANNVIVGSMTDGAISTTASTAGFSAGTLNVGGGVFNVSSAVTLGNFGTGAFGARGTLNLTGGTFNAGTITKSATTRSSGIVNVSGGTLNVGSGGFTASQLNYTGGTITSASPVTLDATTIANGANVANSDVAQTNAVDALVVRDLVAGFGVNLTSSTADTGGIRYDAAGGGIGGTISGDINLGSANRTFNVENSTVATVDLLVSGRISGAVALTKSGAGTLGLSGANTFTGGLTVSGGSVTLSGANANAGAGDVSVLATASNLTIQTGVLNALGNGATLSLAGGGFDGLADVGYAFLGAGVNEQVGFLVLNGVSQPNGTYGATGSGAQFVNDEYFGGTGVLTVVPEPSSAAALLVGIGSLAGLGRLRRRTR